MRNVVMCSSSEIRVDRLGVCLDLVLNILERFEGEFSTGGSEVISLKEGVLVINRARYGG